MVAPQPFFRPRGTPFSVLHRLRALSDLGHSVELVTYPFGEERPVEGVEVHRSARPPGVRDVPVGPSVSKALLDVPLFLEARRRLARGNFDLIHTHEEAGALGAWLSGRTGVPHLYDMHSSLPRQFGNFGRYDWAPVVRAFRGLERYTLRGSAAVIAVCPALEEQAREVGYEGPVAVIENTLGAASGEPDPGAVETLRTELGLGGSRVVVYTGTFEAYQGLDLLLEAIPLLPDGVRSDARFLLVGGDDPAIRRLRTLSARLGVEESVELLPQVPQGRVPAYHRLADVLVTARTRGINTPLKIYEYLHAGRPIVATDVRAHTQVLDEDTAELVAVSAEGLASGLRKVIENPERARDLAENAGRRARERYDEETYMQRLRELLAELRPDEAAVGRAD